MTHWLIPFERIAHLLPFGTFYLNFDVQFHCDKLIWKILDHDIYLMITTCGPVELVGIHTCVSSTVLGELVHMQTCPQAKMSHVSSLQTWFWRGKNGLPVYNIDKMGERAHEVPISHN